MIHTATFNPALDQKIYVKKLIKGQVHRQLPVEYQPSGKGVNVCKVIRALGGAAKAHVLLGGEIGKRFESIARRLTGPLEISPISASTRINTTIVDESDGTHTHLVSLGPAVGSRDLSRFIRKILKAKPRPFAWVFSGSLPAGVSKHVYADLIRSLQAKGIACALDADDEALKMGVRANPWVIKPNLDEFERLVGQKCRSELQIVRLAKKFCKKPTQQIIVTLGSDGALFVSSRHAWLVGVPSIPVMNQVGVGDALLGAFVHYSSRGFSGIPLAFRSVAASLSCVAGRWPTLCRKQDINPFVQKLRVTYLD